MMEILDLIRRRRTARGPFTDVPIPDDHLHAILEAARWAPSSHNTQPWKFVVIDSPDVKEEVARIVLDVVRYDPDLMRAHAPWLRFSPHELEEKRDGIYVKYFRLLPSLGRLVASPPVARCLDAIPALRFVSQEMALLIRQAPVLLCFAVDVRRWFAPGDEDMEGLLSLGACFQNILLMAANLDIGCQPLSSLLEVPEGRRRLQELLGCPPHWFPVTLLRLGYEVRPERSSVRMGLRALTAHNRFGTPLPASFGEGAP